MRKLPLTLLLCSMAVHSVFGQTDTLLANQLIGEAQMLFQQTKYKEAIAKNLEAAKIYEAVFGNPSEQLAKAQKAVAVGYGVLQQFAAAKPYFESVLLMHQQLFGENSLEAGKGYNNMGVVSRRLGEEEMAEVYFKKAVEIYKVKLGEDHETLAGTYSNLSNLFKSQLDFHQTLLYRKAALRIIENKEGKEGIYSATFQKDIGGDYYMQANFQKAMQWYQKALPVYESQLPPSHPYFIDLRSDMASCYCELGDLASAEKWFTQNEEIIVEHYGKEDIRLARNERSFGTCHLKKGNIELAEVKLKNNIRILEEFYPGQQIVIAEAYLLLGECHKATKNHTQAIEAFSKALAQTNFEQSGKADASDYMPCKLMVKMSSTHLGKYTDSGMEADLQAAKNHILSAVDVARQIRKSYSGETSRAFIAEHFFGLFEQAIEINQALHKQTGKAAFAEVVYELIEETNSVMLYEMLQEKSVLSATGLPRELIEQKKILEDSITWLSLEKYKLQGRGVATERDSIEALLFHYNNVYATLLQKFPERFSAGQQNKLLPLTELQSRLKNDESLIQYFEGDTVLMALVINKDNFHLEVLEKKSLNELTENFIQSITQYDPFKTTENSLLENHTMAAHALYQKLIAPLKDKLHKKLVIIPSGQLNFIPFAALLETAPQQLPKIKDWPFLIRNYEIQYAYSARMYTQQKEQNPISGDAIVAYAPVFGKDAQLALFQERSASFSALTYNREEAENIARITSGKTISGLQANKASFLQLAPGASLLHLATHAQANENELGFSGVAFGNSEQEQLYAREIYTLDIPAELVVLSACQTARGTSVQGEGVFSLGRAFTIAGVQSIVSSLWQIDDRQTSKLMTGFYEALVSKKEKSAALRQAQLDYVSASSNALAHPAYWAAFVLHGNNDALTFGGWNIWLSLGVAGIVLLGGLAFFRMRMKRKRAVSFS